VRIGLPCGALLLWWCWLASPARAYEDQLTLGVGAGYAHAVSESLPRSGAMIDVAASMDLHAVWSARARVSYALHPADESLHALLLGAELLYLVDVVELVPYFGLGAVGIGRARAGDTQLDAAAELVLGIDYLVSREITLGLEARPHVLLTELARDPLYLAIQGSVIWMFDR
jgi:hypothetical protein